MSRVPSLKLPLPLSPEELSPRSEEFRENPLSQYSIFPAPKPSSQLANMPNRTIPSQELKNPLLSKQPDYKMQLMTQEQELIALTNIQQKLSEKLDKLQIELETVKDVPNLMREKDKKIKALEVSLELAQEESKMMLFEEISGNKKLVDSKEFFRENKPCRVWQVDPIISEFSQFREDFLNHLRKF